MSPIARSALLLFAPFFLSACIGMPENVAPVQGFDLDRYLGRWYEIARLDHPMERGLTDVTATYSRRDDGGVKVVNRGFKVSQGVWEEVVGRAYFVDDPDQGHLKVSFFGPFYASYVVFELDERNYQYAFVAGPDNRYLWLLSRTPQVDASLLEKFQQRAATLGYNTEELIFLPHERAGELDDVALPP